MLVQNFEEEIGLFNLCVFLLNVLYLSLNIVWYFRYFLQPRSSKDKPSFTSSTTQGTRLSVDNSLGSLRLQVLYTADHVFPGHVYEPLRTMLMQSVKTNVSCTNTNLVCTVNVDEKDYLLFFLVALYFLIYFRCFLQPITSSLVYILGEIISNKMEIAQPLVRVFINQGQIVPIIRALANAEISNLT